jgi:hypothetical protein
LTGVVLTGVALTRVVMELSSSLGNLLYTVEEAAFRLTTIVQDFNSSFAEQGISCATLHIFVVLVLIFLCLYGCFSAAFSI